MHPSTGSRVLRRSSCPLFLFAFVLTLPVVLGIGDARAQADGVPVGGYPSWQERVMMTAVNACRMAPLEFGVAHVAGGILQPGLYPPTHPLRWSECLNVLARSHSEDMAACGIMQHISCDGTSMFDRTSGACPDLVPIHENVGAGHATPFAVVVSWLWDDGSPDGSQDGHRRIIMNSNFDVVGGGYWNAPASTWVRWYTLDLGWISTTIPVLIEGTHIFLDEGSTSFWVNYRDTRASAPQSVKVYVEGVPHDMTLHLGTSNAGTWTIDLDTADSCRTYVFRVVDWRGNARRYPAVGGLRTTGEGGCAEEYEYEPAAVPGAVASTATLEPAYPNPFNPRTNLHVRLAAAADVRLTIVDARGRRVRTLLAGHKGEGLHRVTWDGRDAAGLEAASGTYFALLRVGDQNVPVRKLVLVR